VNKTAMVVGGGVAGMTCALSIAEQGHEVYLLEKEKHLGGMARKLYSTLEGMDVQAYVGDLTQKVYRNPKIHILSEATITEVAGYVGNFITTVKSARGVSEIKHGATVIATGAVEYQPTEYLYGEHDNVVTSVELGDLIAKKDDGWSMPKAWQ
jgi:heterodisulfide reductase subunit A